MKKHLLTFYFALLACAAFPQTTDTSFSKQWQLIDSLIIRDDLPKSALKKVDALYAAAKQKNNQPQIIKALLYKIDLNNKVTEEDINKDIAALKKEIEQQKNTEAKSILQVLLANRYYTFYRMNMWRFSNRNTTAKYSNEDVNTWSPSDFTKAIEAAYTQALQAAGALKKNSVKEFSAIIIKGNTENLRPTLYDLLAHEALDYYKDESIYITKPEYAFEIKEKEALGNAAAFMQHRFASADSSSNLLKALHLFQELMQFHTGDKDPAAFIDVILERIRWVNEHAEINNKEELYKSALLEITEEYTDKKEAAEAWYLLAEIHADKASSYSPFGDTSHRYDYVKAKKMLEERLAKDTAFSEGRADMLDLLQRIMSKNLEAQAEQVNIPNQPFRVFVNYKNADTLYYRIIRKSDIKNTEAHEDYSYNQYFRNLSLSTFISSQAQPLPRTYDYQQHSVEIKADALPVGQYVLLGSSGKNFIDSVDKMMALDFDVSNISFIQNGRDYFVLNRETGEPMKGVKVKVSMDNWDGNVYRKLTIANYTTDEHGFFTNNKLRASESGNYSFAFYTKDDSLITGYAGYYSNYSFSPLSQPDADEEIYEKKNAQLYFFTDRSIYRPGQTLYFKIIGTTKDKNSPQPKLLQRKDSLKIYLKDVNNKKADSLLVKLNDYGSAAGKFKLPAGGITGQFSLSIENFNAFASFNVEEYKRPKFYVEFDTLKSSYKLSDTIHITGFAKAYSGNNIDGATVKYSVQRNARFIYPWLTWRFPDRAGSNKQITQGIIKTDANGKFEIVFAAEPDEGIDKKTDPVFDYSIEVAVTDINGETREGNSSISIGYKSLQLLLEVPQSSEIKDFQNIKVSAKNMNGADVSAAVSIKIYPLQSSGKLFRERYWQQPDQHILYKDEYEKYFPYDVYADEDSYQSWQKSNPVINDSIQTGTTTNYKLQTANWQQGWYAIEATAKDKDGNEVKDIKYVQLFDAAGKDLPSPQMNWQYAIKDKLLKNDTAKLAIATAEKNVFIIQNISSGNSGIYSYDGTLNTDNQYSYFTLSNSKKIIEYKMDNDNEAVGLYYAFVKHNRAYTGGTAISILHPERELKIGFASFRNKTEPGSKETYTITVSGSKGEKAAAELLTGMYDASLDQFRNHNWRAPYVWNSFYVSNYWNGNTCFKTENSIENLLEDANLYYDKTYLSLAKSMDDLLIKEHGATPDDINRFGGDVNKMRKAGYYITEERELMAGNVIMRENEPGPKTAIRGNISMKKYATPKIVADLEGGYDLASARKLDLTGAVPYLQIKGTQMGAAPNIQPRRNFNETAFFFPQLYADTSGNYSFSFTMPEALTKWKWMALAHTKELAFGYDEQTIITQKKLMVQPGLPRFVREGDVMEFSAKISNLSDSEFTGTVTMQLTDAATNEPVDASFSNAIPQQYFTAAAGQSAVVKFPVNIPFSANKPVTIKIIAQAAALSDGEENTLPVLTNRTLVTETLPIFIKHDTTQQFRFEKLLQNKSATLQHNSLTVEFTSNPVWYAVQSLPYLMENENECSEQAFNRFYANALAAYIVQQHPRIATVLEQWKNDTTAFNSALQNNQELKQLLIEETPWVLDAENETQQKKNVALLFDMLTMKNNLQSSLNKLVQLQKDNGAFAWFKGGLDDRYITQYILTGIGRLKQLNAISEDFSTAINDIVNEGINYLDAQISNDYKSLLKYKANLSSNNIGSTQIQYLYMRSYFSNIIQYKTSYNYYYQQMMKYWRTQSNYMKAMIGLTLMRTYQQRYVSDKIFPSLMENAVETKDRGMYWKDAQYGYYWYNAPVEQQALMIELAASLSQNKKTANYISEMKTWLITQKQTNHWATTKATADACFALLLRGSNWLSEEKKVSVQLGNITFNNDNSQAGTGYFKQRIDGSKINNQMGNINVNVSSSSPLGDGDVSPSYGSIYWQYFEDLDKITTSSSPLSLTKKLFIEKNSAQGKILQAVNDNDELHIGDKLIIRITLTSDRNMQYLHLKDMRAACMEPLNTISEYKWQDALGYYESTRDAATNFFISSMQRGTYVFEYPVFITHTGTFSAGIANIQCMYAPEFSSHSEGIKIDVKDEEAPNP